MDTIGGGGAMPGYMMDNGQTWNYNSGGVATVGGNVHGSQRQRSVNRRAALPTVCLISTPSVLESEIALLTNKMQNWTEHGGMGMPNLQSYSNGLAGAPMSNGGLRVDGPGSHPSPNSLQSVGNDADQLIPTAIVIKNIPFAVRKETLASIMLDMHLPQPYAFNYHFDNGVFRGLAFANFQSAEDTRVVIEAMNGMDVHGRKLRVEYKKMLPEAERERIEREKRERRGQLEEQHRAPILHNQSSIQSLGGMSQAQARTPSVAPISSISHLGRVFTHKSFIERFTDEEHIGDIDLNDPQTLEFYTELAMFRRDDSREILVFPPGIAPEHRRSIHILAHHMGLEHQSIGEADSRQLTVLKRRQPSPTADLHTPPASSLDVHKRGLSRAATFDFAADRESRAASNNYAHLVGRHGPTLELPGSPDGTGIPNNLRAAKSFADLRSFTPSPSQASSSYLAPGSGLSGIAPASTARFGDYLSNGSQSQSGNPSTPGAKNDNGLVSGLSGLSLSPFEASGLQSQARNTPGAIGSQRPSANGNGTTKGAPERQPRGPEWETSNGFGRTRANGHMQRGSGTLIIPLTPTVPRN